MLKTCWSKFAKLAVIFIKDSIQTIDADSIEGKLTLLEQANKFAHNLHSVVYEMQQTVSTVHLKSHKLL